MIPQVMAHCWLPTRRPRLVGGDFLVKSQWFCCLPKAWGERFHQFGNIHWDLSRANAHTETIYDTANDQHSDILRGTDDDRADAPIGKNKKTPISLPILKMFWYSPLTIKRLTR